MNFSERFDIHRIVADCQAAMHYVELDVVDTYGNEVKINSLFDSGTQISVLKADAVKKLSYSVLGKVTLQTFDNRVSTGDLVSFDVRLNGGQSYHQIRFVICDNVSHDCLLSLADYRRLLDLESVEPRAVTGEHDEFASQVSSASGGSVDSHLVDVDIDNDVEGGEYADIASFAEPSEMINPDSSQVADLIAEQAGDDSLSGAFALARDGKGGYLMRNGLLFH